MSELKALQEALLALHVQQGEICRVCGTLFPCTTAEMAGYVTDPNNCQHCWACVPNYRFMMVCIDCGNKRCPKANDHQNACTRSNEPGQPGSVYPLPPSKEDIQRFMGRWRNGNFDEA